MALARTNRGNGTIAYTGANVTTNTITSASFTPGSGVLILVMFSETTTDTTPSLTMSTSGFTTGTWTIISSTAQNDGFGNYGVTRIAYAVTTSGSAGTVTCTRRAGSFVMGAFAEFISISGQHGTPIARSVTNVVSGASSMSLNLSGTPTSSSYLFTVGMDFDGSAGTIPSGFTALASTTIGFTPKHAEKLGSGSQNNSWTGLGNFWSAGVLVEVAAQVAVAATGREVAAGFARTTGVKKVAKDTGRTVATGLVRGTPKKAARPSGREVGAAAPRATTRKVLTITSARLHVAATPTVSNTRRVPVTGRVVAAAPVVATTQKKVSVTARRAYGAAVPHVTAVGSLYSSTFRNVIGRAMGGAVLRVTVKHVSRPAGRTVAAGRPRATVKHVATRGGRLIASPLARSSGVKRVSKSTGRVAAGGWPRAIGGRYLAIRATAPLRLFGGAVLKGYPILAAGPPPPPPQISDPITYVTPSPPPDLLDAFFESGVVRIRRRIEIYEFDGETIWMRDAPLVGGSISVDVDRDERRMADITLDNEDRELDHYPEGFWYDKILKVYWGIETDDEVWETQLGEFMIDAISDEHFPHTIDLKARDYTKKLMVDKFAVATLFAKGMSAGDAIQTIASGNTDDPLVGVAKFNIDDGGKVLGVDVVFERQTSRWEAISKIAESYGLEVFFDRFGYLTVRPYRDPVISPTVFTFQTGASSNLASYRKSSNDSRLVNHFTVTGVVAENGIPAYGEASNVEPSSPTRINKIGRRSDGIDNALITDSNECAELANQYLKVAGLESYELSMEAVNAPWLEVGEAVEFINPRPAPGEPKRFYMTSLNLPLALGTMSATAKRVQIVGGLMGTGPGITPPPGTPPPPPPPPPPPGDGVTFEAELGELFTV